MSVSTYAPSRVISATTVFLHMHLFAHSSCLSLLCVSERSTIYSLSLFYAACVGVDAFSLTFRIKSAGLPTVAVALSATLALIEPELCKNRQYVRNEKKEVSLKLSKLQGQNNTGRCHFVQVGTNRGKSSKARHACLEQTLTESMKLTRYTHVLPTQVLTKSSECSVFSHLCVVDIVL